MRFLASIMNKPNFNYQPFLLILGLSFILTLSSFFNSSFNLAGYQSKKINFLDDIFSFQEIKKVPLPSLIVSGEIVAKDSAELFARKIDTENIVDTKIDSGSTALSHFFEALSKTKNKEHKTRIAYFGDSMIEGDLITQDFRSLLQNTFGGSGVGFVPITSIVAGFRTSIQHSFGNFTTYNLMQDAVKSHPLGISGYSFVPEITNTESATSTNSWVKYTATNKKHLNEFENFSIIYGISNDDNYLLVNQSKKQIDGKKDVNLTSFNFEKPVKSIDAKFFCNNALTIFGCSVESTEGIIVDNFSFRGNAGMGISKTNDNILQLTQSQLQYDLIILEYGLNAVSPKVTDFSWYEKGMDNTIKKIKRCFPNTSILLISVGDKAYKKESNYETDPSVPILVASQKHLAEKNKIAFWSLYDAIGGEGTMVKWVECDTPLANKDYTHFNFRGAHKVGTLLYNKLMSEFKDYKKENFKP